MKLFFFSCSSSYSLRLLNIIPAFCVSPRRCRCCDRSSESNRLLAIPSRNTLARQHACLVVACHSSALGSACLRPPTDPPHFIIITPLPLHYHFISRARFLSRLSACLFSADRSFPQESKWHCDLGACFCDCHAELTGAVPSLMKLPCVSHPGQPQIWKPPFIFHSSHSRPVSISPTLPHQTV